jgi:hypothetical protein
MYLIKGAFVGEKNFERYKNARYNNKKNHQHVLAIKTIFWLSRYS